MLDLARMVQTAGEKLGLTVEIDHLSDPRVEAEEHYYNAKHSKLIDLGLKPHLAFGLSAGLADECRLEYRDRIDPSVMLPRVNWRQPSQRTPRRLTREPRLCV